MKNITRSTTITRDIIAEDGTPDIIDVPAARILWFSRHEMTAEQEDDLRRIYGDILIEQHSATINRPEEIPGLMEYDVWAIVAPLPLQQQFLKMAGERPVIFCKSERILLPDGEKVQFKFAGWHRIKRIEVVTEAL